MPNDIGAGGYESRWDHSFSPPAPGPTVTPTTRERIPPSEFVRPSPRRAGPAVQQWPLGTGAGQQPPARRDSSMIGTLAAAAALALAPGQSGALNLTNVRPTYGELGATRTDNRYLPGD